MSATLLSKNLSHRHLIKQKTKQLFYYVPSTSKLPTPQKSPYKLRLNFKSSDQINEDRTGKLIEKQNLCQKDDNDHDTSINLDCEGSARGFGVGGDGRLVCQWKTRKSLRVDGKGVRPRGRSGSAKFRSMDAISDNKSNSPSIAKSISIRKLPQSLSNPKISKPPTMQNLPNPNLYPPQPTAIPKSETALGAFKNTSLNTTHNLKKTSASRMKLKVFDPFQKRSRLDRQFKNQESVIDRVEDSLMSTLNREQFEKLVNDM